MFGKAGGQFVEGVLISGVGIWIGWGPGVLISWIAD